MGIDVRNGIVAGLLTVALIGACTGGIASTPSPQPRPVVTSRSTMAPPTAAPPTPTPLVTPVPAPTGIAADVIDAFFSEFALVNKPFHVDTDVEFTGTSGTQTESGTVEVNGDIHGQDFDGEVIVLGERVIVRVVDGEAFGREAGGEWITLPDFQQTQPLNPFGLLEPADVVYVGATDRDGQQVHELRFTRWIGGELEAEGLSRIELLGSDFAVHVTTNGIPVEAILDFSISANVAGYARPFEFDYHVVYLFSDVGKRVEIRSPL